MMSVENGSLTCEKPRNLTAFLKAQNGAILQILGIYKVDGHDWSKNQRV